MPLPMGEVPEAERAIFPSQSASPPAPPEWEPSGEREERIVTGGNPRRGLRQCELHYGITATGSYYNFDSLRGAPLARNDMRDTAAPTGVYEGSWGNGLDLIRHGCAVPPSPPRGRLALRAPRFPAKFLFIFFTTRQSSRSIFWWRDCFVTDLVTLG